MTTDRDPKPRRFSEGMEHMPALVSSARMGTFADGMVTAGLAAVTRPGTFANGQILRPDSAAARRVGTFADRSGPAAEMAPIRPRLGAVRGRPGPEPA
jgi:hypothetical protein